MAVQVENDFLTRALAEAMVEPIPMGAEIKMDALFARERLVHEYAWAIPNDAALKTIASHGPIVEIGAGNGYWAMLLRERGVDVAAYDPVPYEEGHYIEIAGKVVTRKEWSKVEAGDHTAVARHPDRTLFLCWPSNAESWAAEALSLYKGDKVIYIGEWGGCTADAAFHVGLEERWHPIARVNIPNFWPVHDFLSVWQRSK